MQCLQRFYFPGWKALQAEMIRSAATSLLVHVVWICAIAHTYSLQTFDPCNSGSLSLKAHISCPIPIIGFLDVKNISQFIDHIEIAAITV